MAGEHSESDLIMTAGDFDRHGTSVDGIGRSIPKSSDMRIFPRKGACHGFAAAAELRVL
jgi:hypothetical protein